MDFVTEFTPESGAAYEVHQISPQLWKIYIDGASNARGSSIGIVLESLEGIRMEDSLRLGF